MMRRLQVRGFIITDHAARWANTVRVLAGPVFEGKLQPRETVAGGFENPPAALRRLFGHSTTGKLVVWVTSATYKRVAFLEIPLQAWCAPTATAETRLVTAAAESFHNRTASFGRTAPAGSVTT